MVERLRQWGNTDSAPAGADTAAAVGKYRERSCGSRHCCGSGEIQIALLREQILLRQWGNTDSAPAGAGTAAAVKKTAGGDSCGGVGLLGKGMGRCGWIG